MSTLRAFLSGRKSYLLGFGIVVVAGLYSQGYIDESEYLTLLGLLNGGGLASLRAGVKKSA